MKLHLDLSGLGSFTQVAWGLDVLLLPSPAYMHFGLLFVWSRRLPIALAGAIQALLDGPRAGRGEADPAICLVRMRFRQVRCHLF